MWLTDISQTETRRLSSLRAMLSRETACLSARGVVFFFHYGDTGMCDELRGGDAVKYPVCTKRKNGAED